MCGPAACTVVHDFVCVGQFEGAGGRGHANEVTAVEQADCIHSSKSTFKEMAHYTRMCGLVRNDSWLLAHAVPVMSASIACGTS